MSAYVSDRRFEELPVFPLPKLVLFPGTALPLHVFEPRYRDMMADCLRTGSPLIAVAQLKPGWEPAYEGRPAIYDVAGVGRITEHKKNPDGTYDIVLDALARVHLRELAAEGLSYRRAQATVLNDRLPKTGIDATDVAALLSLATRISTIVKHALPGFALQASVEDAPALLTDRIADQLVLDPSARQDLLETLDVGARVRTLTGHLAQLHMALSSAGSDTPPTVH
jgi:Lon protease-like protein